MLLHRNNMGGIPDLCMHACILAYWGRSKHGSIAGTVPDTSRHTYRCGNNAQGCQPGPGIGYGTARRDALATDATGIGGADARR